MEEKYWQATSITLQRRVWGGVQFTVKPRPRALSLMREPPSGPTCAMTGNPRGVVMLWIVQFRGGPSTGLPTASAQPDMMQRAYGARHGDYDISSPFCPNSSRGVVSTLTIKAFQPCDMISFPLPVHDIHDGRMRRPHEVKSGDSSRRPSSRCPAAILQSPVEDYLPYATQRATRFRKWRHAGEGYNFHVNRLDSRRTSAIQMTLATQDKWSAALQKQDSRCRRPHFHV